MAALLRGGNVTLTTALHGAGGFGKTTVAKMVRCDQRVLGEFGNRVYWVTVGRDTGTEALTGLVNGLIGWIQPGKAGAFTDVRQAAEYLMALLAEGPRRLLVVDDVWSETQLAAFPVAGQCARLVTTRFPLLVEGSETVRVRVDQMSVSQAHAVLSAGLQPIEPVVAGALLLETGRWPLLLRLVNKILLDQARFQVGVSRVAEDLLRRLRSGGALQLDELTGAAEQRLDVSDPEQRSRALRTTIQASIGLLSDRDHNQLAELAVFAEDETIPVTLIAALWRASGGLDELAARALCARLSDLALIDPVPGGDGAAVTMHDVIREYLGDELGSQRLAETHQALLDAVAADLPALARTEVSGGHGTVTAWWKLPVQARYLWDHLISHLLAAGHQEEADAVACDLEWVAARLEQAGPAAPYADLALAHTVRAGRLQRLIGQAVHLLGPTQPAYSVTDVLCSRVSHDPEWGPQARALQATRLHPALLNRWPLPDLPDPLLQRVMASHGSPVLAVAVVPDSTWVIVGYRDATIRIWDAATGRQRAVLEGHTDEVKALAIAPDGNWLASGSDDGSVRIWNVTTGQQRFYLTSHTRDVRVIAIAPDGTWLASGGLDKTVRIWDTITWQQRAALNGHSEAVFAMAVDPDGTWLATSGADRMLLIWDTSTWQQRACIRTGYKHFVGEMVAAPDGTWIAAGGLDKTVRIWDTATGQQRAELEAVTSNFPQVNALVADPACRWLASGDSNRMLTIWDTGSWRQRVAIYAHNGPVEGAAAASDGTWIATGSWDGTVRVWDTAFGQQHPTDATLRDDTSLRNGVEDWVLGLATAPDGTWIATCGYDHAVRIWDTITGQQRAVLEGHWTPVNAVAIAPDGTWIATGSEDCMVWIWDTATRRQRAVLEGHAGAVKAVAIAPDGTWIASGSEQRGIADTTMRIWDAATGQQRVVLEGHSRTVTAVAIGPDSTWLASTSQDTTVRIWDAATGQQRAVLEGHERAVNAVAIAADGTWIVTGSDDETVRIWDTNTWRQRAILHSHTAEVMAVAITPDGAWLASAGKDGAICIWEESSAEFRAVIRVDSILTACQWTSHPLSVAAAGENRVYLFTFKH